MLMTHPETHAILVGLGWAPHGDFLGNNPHGPYDGHATTMTMYRSADAARDLPLLEAYKASGHVATPTHMIEWRAQGEAEFRPLVVNGIVYIGTLAYMQAAMGSRPPMTEAAEPGDLGAFKHPLFGWQKYVRVEYRLRSLAEAPSAKSV